MVLSEMFLITEYLLLVQTGGAVLWCQCFFLMVLKKRLFILIVDNLSILASLVLQKYYWANGHLLNEEKKPYIWTKDRCIGLYK